MFDTTWGGATVAGAVTLAIIMFICGRVSVTRSSSVMSLRRRIAEKQSAERLGKFVSDPQEVQALAQAYADPRKAESELPQYPWDIKLTPTPFVGVMPMRQSREHVQVNDQHFRSPTSIPIEKPAGEDRVFLVGGSTAFGVGVPDDGTVAVFLEAHLDQVRNRASVTTAACPAWASTHERILIENVLAVMAPDAVVCLSGFNEAHWAWNRRNVRWFNTYGDEHFNECINFSRAFVGHSRIQESQPQLDTEPSPQEVADVLSANVHLAAVALTRTGCPKYVFALQPCMPVTEKELTEREATRFAVWHPVQVEYYRACYESIRDSLGDLAGRMDGFQFVDCSRVFDDLSSQDEIFIDGSHCGDRGNRMVAERIAGDW
ncbi:MAG: hypothetical protein HOH43_09555 [Candidatus Latescibacteria bacterium]|jgi:hypothetical protein|nr:hypothetical protein [Gemmatimonadota bacterium]MBT5873653.1 hypothetical protein [Candidatus Latescibacterota bacterium]